jgi:hypothetical protein
MTASPPIPDSDLDSTQKVLESPTSEPKDPLLSERGKIQSITDIIINFEDNSDNIFNILNGLPVDTYEAPSPQDLLNKSLSQDATRIDPGETLDGDGTLNT